MTGECVECGDWQVGYWCSTCKGRVCDCCIEHCVTFGHDWGDVDDDAVAA